ncbi:MAG TPA: PRC-barrel domain-containing protein [Candidatus Thermoplasmatota archaeon]|nr:PRC-barrel domain-containing protein [Candidatus Thermoplasmatota archaeon]
MPEPVRYPISDLTRRSVVDAEGRKLGDVKSLECNPLTWHVDRVRVKLTHDAISRLHLERDHGLFEDRTVEVPTEFVRVQDDYLVVSEPERLIAEEYRREHGGPVDHSTLETL